MLAADKPLQIHRFREQCVLLLSLMLSTHSANVNVNVQLVPLLSMALANLVKTTVGTRYLASFGILQAQQGPLVALYFLLFCRVYFLSNILASSHSRLVSCLCTENLVSSMFLSLFCPFFPRKEQMTPYLRSWLS